MHLAVDGCLGMMVQWIGWWPSWLPFENIMANCRPVRVWWSNCLPLRVWWSNCLPLRVWWPNCLPLRVWWPNCLPLRVWWPCHPPRVWWSNCLPLESMMTCMSSTPVVATGMILRIYTFYYLLWKYEIWEACTNETTEKSKQETTTYQVNIVLLTESGNKETDFQNIELLMCLKKDDTITLLLWSKQSNYSII